MRSDTTQESTTWDDYDAARPVRRLNLAVSGSECQRRIPLPTYEYACTACGHRLEAVQSFSDDPLTECPECGAALRKVYGAVGIVLKGSGFYKTDSRAAAAGSKGSPAKKADDAAGGSPPSEPAAKEPTTKKDTAASGGDGGAAAKPTATAAS
jgi:putative FmdB family regulatory protein